MNNRNIAVILGAAALAAQALVAAPMPKALHVTTARTRPTVSHVASASYIVQAPNFALAVTAVKNAGGKITHELLSSMQSRRI